MLRRHADAAYWIGRYIERAEATARMIDVHYHFGLESTSVHASIQWSSILAISEQEDTFREQYDEETEESILQFFVFDEQNHSSILSCVRFARENARSIRDQISSEMWEAVNRQYLELQQWNVDRILTASPFAFFQRVKEGAQLFQGITNRTLMMGESRDFHDAGRFMERADQTARILDVKYHALLPQDTPAPEVTGVGGPVDVHGWVSVLKSVGAYEAFRKTFHQGVTPARVAQFLVLNPQFPASVRHSIGRVEGCLRRVSRNRDLAPVNTAEREVGRLYNDLNYLRAEEIIANGLHEFLTDVLERCDRIGVAIHETYLSY